MSEKIPASYLDLLTQPLTVTLATTMPDGQPQLTAVWCVYEGGQLLISAAADTQKVGNLAANPRATVMAIDTAQPQRYLEVRGTVVLDGEGVPEIRKRIMLSYDYPADALPTHESVILRLTPTHVVARG